MKKAMNKKPVTFTVLAFMFLFSVNVFSQHSNDIFGKGDNVLSGGVGLGGYYDYTNSTGYSQSPSFSLCYENCTIDPFGANGAIGLGAYISYFSSDDIWTDVYNYSDKYTFEFLTARAAYHYHIRYSAKIDPYGGLTLGYVLAQHNFTTDDPNAGSQASPAYAATHYQSVSPLAYGGFLGLRYFFGNTFGIYAELVIFNGGYNYIGLGATFKFSNR